MSAQELSTPIAPGTSVRFDPTLIASLTREHRKMVELLLASVDLAKRGKAPAATRVLAQLQTMFSEHLLKERGRLHIFLSRKYEGDLDITETLRRFDREMRPISKEMREFLQKYQETPVSPLTAERFLKEASRVGEALLDRITMEEGELYPLYRWNEQGGSKA
ncbi:MAG: hemerythrin domain-containing protein [Acidiferrobacterales bacterium]